MNEVKLGLHRIRDADLELRIERLLLELYWINEAPGSSVMTMGGSGSDDSDRQIPRGVRKRRTLSQLGPCPPRHRFLFDWYAWQFAHAESDTERRMLCVKAEVDLGKRHKLHEGDEGRSHAEQMAIEREQARVLCEHGEGVHAADIAAEQDWPIGWVKDTRRRGGRDPEWGHALPVWRDLPDDERTAIARDYHRRDYSQRRAAAELGIGQATLARYWPTSKQRAAAA